MRKRLTRVGCASVIAFVSTTASAALVDIGNGMIYDSAQNLTWMQNANVNANNGSNGRMTWYEATAWVENLVYGGYDDWRLPATLRFDDPSCPEDVRGILLYEHHVGCTGGEMEKLTVELYDGNYPLGDLNEGPFINIRTDTRYWAATPYRDGMDPCVEDGTCNIDNDNGIRTDFYWQWSFVKTQDTTDLLDGPFKTTLRAGNHRYAWAVRTGGPATVPLPASIWLVGSGLIGLIGRSRKRDKGVIDGAV